MSTKWRRRGCRPLFVAISLATAVAALGGATDLRAPPVAAPYVVPVEPSTHFAGRGLTHGTLATSRLGNAAVTWLGGPTTTTTGETVTVFVSASLPTELGTPQTWADYFAALLHGPEIRSLIAYIATYAEVQELCQAEDVLGCYGSSTLVSIGESLPGIGPGEVASHEYGHHVAANRDNFPWRAIDWGTKRWATAANICMRAANASVFPGDEGDRYRLNPGEGFVESYRVANERRRGASSSTWQIVDPSFYPDASALQAVERDVVEPWVKSPPSTYRGRFAQNGKKTWSLAVATPLDGQLGATLVLPQARPYRFSLLTSDGKTVLAKASWSSAKTQAVTFTVCGQRAVLLRVTRVGPAGSFSVSLTKP